MKNYLVTGGAGFIGSRLACALVARGDKVTIVDNLSTGLRKNIPDAATFLLLDIGEADFIDKLPQEPFDAVLHLAAQSSGPASQDIPLVDTRVNALSTLLLTRWCLEHGTLRFLYASSMAVYGNPEKLPIEETEICAPLSYYGISKLASEHYLRLATLEGLSCTAFRIFSVFGPGQNLANQKQGMASIYLSYLLRGQEIPVTGSLDRFRDLLYVDDIVSAWIIALDLPATPSLIYNLASGTSVTVRNLIAALIDGLDLPVDYPVVELSGSANDQFGAQADISRITEELGWAPCVEMEQGMRQFTEWGKSVSENFNRDSEW